MRRRSGLIAVTWLLVTALAGIGVQAASANPADRQAGSSLATRLGVPASAPSWFTAADLEAGVPTAADLAAVAAGSPADPVVATTDLVQTIFGSDREAAIAATGEVLRRAGLPLVSALGPIVAMPDDAAETIVNAPIEVEFIPMLADSIRGGVFWTPDQVGQLLAYERVTATAYSGAQVVGILDEWGKGAKDPTESVVAGTAVRALAAERHQLLIPSMVADAKTQAALADDPSSLTDAQYAEVTAPARLIGLDPLQTILLLAHAAARTQSQLGAGGGLRRAQASADGPCPDTSSEGAAAAKALGKSQAQNAIGGAIGRKWGEGAAENFGKAGEALDKAEEVISTALLVLGAHLDLESDKDATHFRHESGDTSRDVHFTATASFHSPIGGQNLTCWAFAGIDVPPDGPLNGYKITWKIDGSPDVLDVVGKDSSKVQDGETTGSDGKSTLEAYPMTERNPPKDGEDEPEQTVPQTVIASLSKDDFPFHLKDLVGITEGGPYAAAAKELVNVMEGLTKKVGLPSESKVIQVTYHGVNPYVGKGDSSLDVILAKVDLHADLYSCKGPEGPWKGTVSLGGDLADIYSIFGLPTSGTLSGNVSFSLNGKSSSPQTFDVKPKFQIQITLDPDAVQNAEHPPQGAGGSDRILGGAVIGTGTWIANGENWEQDAALLGPLVPTPQFDIKTVRKDPRCPGSTLDDDYFDPTG